MADTIDNVKIYKKVSKTGVVADQYVVVNLDATNFYVTLNATHTVAEEFGYVWDNVDNLNDTVLWKNTSSAQFPRAYYVDANGQTQGVWGFTSTVVAGTIVLRDNSGHVKTEAPSADEDAATKLYVDNSIASHTHSIADVTDVSTIGTTAVSTKTISTNSASIASGNTDLVTGGAIYSYVDTEGGKIKEIRINGATQTVSAGVVNLPAYPSVSNSTITIKQTGIDDQTFTLNGNAATITLADTNTWRPLGTGASDAAAGNHTHTVFNGLRINTGVNTTPLKISRGTYDAESVSYGVNDGAHIIEYTNDEVNSTILWRLINTDTEDGGGASASTHSMALSASPDGVDLRLDGIAVSLNGHTHSQYLTSQSNDFGKIKVGATTTTAGSIQDTITFAAGGDLGVSISGKTITYSVTLPTQLPASDVSAWAKAANKPSYTAAEVGALPDSTTYLKSISKSGSTYTITDSDSGTTTWTIPTIPSNISAFNNDAGYLTTVAWGDVTGKPSTFTPSAHTHSVADVTDISSIGTTAVSTVTISTSSADIAAGSSKLVTGGAIADALADVSYRPTVVDDTIIFN